MLESGYVGIQRFRDHLYRICVLNCVPTSTVSTEFEMEGKKALAKISIRLCTLPNVIGKKTGFECT